MVVVKPNIAFEERAMESLLLQERRPLIEKGVARQFIKIRKQVYYLCSTNHTESTIKSYNYCSYIITEC